MVPASSSVQAQAKPLLITGLLTFSVVGVIAQSTNSATDLNLPSHLTKPQNEMRVVAQRYDADRANITRFYNVPLALERTARLKVFDADWLAALQKLNTNKLSGEAQTELKTLLETVKNDSASLDNTLKSQAKVAPFVPFAADILNLEASRRSMATMDAEKDASKVEALARAVDAAKKSVKLAQANSDSTKYDFSQVGRAVETVNSLRTVLKNWAFFYNGYDPLFTWWMAMPDKEADKALADYSSYLSSLSGSTTTATFTGTVSAPTLPPVKLLGKGSEVPDLAVLMAVPQSQMQGVIQQFNNNGGRGGRGGGGGGGRGGGRRGLSKETLQQWLDALPKLDFASFSHDDQVDYILLRNRIEYQLMQLNQRSNNAPATVAAAPVDNSQLIPFEETISQLGQDKQDTNRAATTIATLKTAVDKARKDVGGTITDPAVSGRAARAATTLGGLRGQLGDWHDRQTADVPWPDSLTANFKALDQAVEDYGAFLRENATGSAQATGGAQADGSDIVGHPIGHEGLMTDLHDEMIPYTPEELITIGEKEFAWCESEMKKASRQMGFGDDWHKAVEKAKTMNVPVGQQPYLIRDLAWDAVNYLEKHDLITVPIVARETWGMDMMSPQRQLVNPFFTGGAVISVSYPTDTMTHEQKMESIRGNNIPFAHATVFHELIPGHELQGFTSSRYYTERRMFNTPFYGEGWACYWELYMYQRGYDPTPEEKIGALFWRMHRCARIIFSLNFHLGKWTPKQCIDFLVDSMGHERDNATAEVRRSFDGSYSPLYQAAYLLGALQLLDLHKELVESGKVSERAFHDAVVQANSMPIVMIRAIVSKEKLTPDWKPNWRFCGENPTNWKP
jgi:uncharacterized protein (DUF885 family)